MISVITVVKDDAPGLAATFQSLQIQSHADWELILVASPSLDNTIEVANSLVLKDGRVNLHLQEADGIYEAMNLGISKVQGSQIWFMNAGDTFASIDVLEHALTIMQETGVSMVIGGYKLGQEDESRSFNYRSRNISRTEFAFNLRMCHQAMMFSSEAYMKIGKFDLRYRLASDFDFILRFMQSYKARTTGRVYAVFRPGGAADQRIFQVHKEKHLSRIANFQSPLIVLASIIWSAAAQAKIRLRRIFR